jgi:signal transduction histidine kinase
VTGELLKERTRSLETTLQAMSQGLMVVGADGRIRVYNQQACAFLDVPETLMASLPLLSDVVSFQSRRGDFGPGYELVEDSAREYVATGSTNVGASVPRKYVRRTPAGRFLEIKSNPLPGGGFVRTFTDVTSYVEALNAVRDSGAEISRLNETLEQRVAQRTAELERSMHDIEALSYSIAHDLRGPLRAVNGFAALIAADEAEHLSPDGRELFDRITEASRRMGEMITDLLELFKVVRAELNPVSVDLAALAQSAVRSLASSFPDTEVDVEPMPMAQGDATLLRHLVFNLMDNALKYSSRAAAPRITVGWDAAAHAWFVRDNGVGFDMAKAQKLFGLFQRLHSPADYPGSGVGLAVVARIVERHGGRIWAEAAPGLGANFRFTLGPEPVL